MFRDAYHQLLSMNWPKFFGLVATTYFCVNLLFAFAYYACGSDGFIGLRIDTPFDHFSDCFFFSVQTLATIGYGRISPVTLLPNLLVAVEALVGLLGLALITGLFFVRFARPTARVVFSRNALIRNYEGENVLMIRLANERLNLIAEAQVMISLARNEILSDGERFRSLVDLKLRRQRTPMFSFTWTVMHVIDETSPLFGKTQEDLETIGAELIVALSGLDETFAQIIYSRHSYKPEHFLWNSKFVDMLFQKDGHMALDLTKIHEVNRA
jgi:inward rectifier potassium channel